MPRKYVGCGWHPDESAESELELLASELLTEKISEIITAHWQKILESKNAT